MSCQQTHDLIHAYVDGELDLVNSLEFERHLEHCPACTEKYDSLRTLKKSLANSALRFDPPAGVEKRLRTALRQENAAATRTVVPHWRWLAIAASLIAAVTIVWIVAAIYPRRSTDDLLAQEIVSSHVRSLMADHLTDVPSSDRHSVKPWFNGKLDFSPSVKDLGEQGFNLNGGRLDYIGNRPVAALVYQHRQHSINLFVWPSSEVPEKSEKAQERQGFNLICWSTGGMTYWAISDLNLAELQQFAQLIRQQNQARLWQPNN